MSNYDSKELLENNESKPPLISSLGAENIFLEITPLEITPTKDGGYLDRFNQEEVELLTTLEKRMAETETEPDSILFPVHRHQPAITQGLPTKSQTSKELTGAEGNNLISVEPEPLEASVNEIKGTPSREVIEGTEGNDRITGEFGADTISGGAGEDIFVYESLRDAGDIILDFELNKDKIDLSTVLSSIGYQGDSPLADGYVTLTAYDGGTVVNLDSDGTGGRESRAYIRVQGVTPEELASNPNHICPHPEVVAQLAPEISVPGLQSVTEDESLTISGIGIADDDGSIGELEVNLSVSNGVVSLGATEGLTFITGDGTEDSTLVFTGALADLNAAINNLVYQGNPNFHGDDGLVITVRDLGNTTLTDTETIEIAVNPVNDAPLVNVPEAQTVPEDEDLTITDISVADIDSSNLQVTMTVVNGGLTLSQTTGLTFTAGDGIDDSTLTFTGSVEDVNNGLSQITYRGNANFNGNDEIVLTVTDGELNDTETITVTVTPVNDTPILTVPDSQTVPEDTDIAIAGIALADLDVDRGDLEVTVSASHGVLSLGQTDGLTFSTGDGTADASLVFTGTLSDINNALSQLTYRGNSNFNGDDNISIKVSDLGNTGAGGELTDSKVIGITVTSVNNPPTLTIPEAQTVPEDQSLSITGIQVDDTDSNQLEVNVTVNNGVISLNSTEGLTITNGDGIEDSNLILTGSIADINNALAQITYRGSANFNGNDQIVFTVSDGELEATETIPVTVTPVNDAPILTVPISQTVPENTDLSITEISINDLDVGSENIEVTLTVSNGVLSLSETTGLNFTTGDGTEDTSLTFTGSLEDVNNAIAQLTYRGNTNFNGNDNISITVNDLGNTGAGGELTDSKVIPITITSVNQPPVTDPDKFLAIPDDGSVTPLNINAPTDPDGDELTITVNEIPATDKGRVRLANGTIVEAGRILTIAELQELQFIPVSGETGAAGNFSYTVDDGQGGTDSQTITFNITPVIVLLEGSSFRVSESQEIIIPNESSVLSFTYDSLSFDRTNLDFINDAFEAALVDKNGNSLVHTIGEGRDSFFNLTEDNPAELAPGVTLDGQTVTVNLAGIEPGTTANLILRLVNDDGDITTTVRISNIELETVANLESPKVTPEVASLQDTDPINFDRLSNVSNSIQAEYGQTSFNEEEQILFAEVTLENVGTYGVNTPLLVAVNNLSDPTVTVVNADGLTPDGLPYYDFSDLVTSGQLEPSELTASKTLSFRNPSGEQFTYELLVLSELNSAPVIESQPNLEIIGGLSYSYEVKASDLDGDSLTYELLVAPQGMSINASTAEISWDTTVDDIANHDITVQVSDGRGGVSRQNFVLSVIEEPPNRPPIFTTSPVVDAYINQLYEYDADAIDPDLDPLSFSLILGPEGMRINSDTGVVEWTPPPSLVLGDTILGQIGLPGENDEFSFTGVVGQQIYFDPLQFTGNSSNWNFAVFSPSGQKIVDTNLESGNNQLVTLSETGNYRIVVDAEDEVTGSYGFSVIDLNLTPVAPFDTLIEGQLSPGSEDDVYRFTGNAGQKLFFDSLDSSSGSLNWVLYDSSNQVVTSSNFTDLEFYLPNDGEYVLAIRGTGSLTDITTYAFEIITPDEITTPITLGSTDNPNTVFGEISEKGEEDFYIFEGNRGERIYFDGLFFDFGSNTSPEITIVSPSGLNLTPNFNSARGSGGDGTNPIFLPEDGIYKVGIDIRRERTGSYGFNLLDLGLATSVDLDTEIAGDFGESRTETRLYRFNGNQGQQLYFNQFEGDSNNVYILYDPAGQQVFSRSLDRDLDLVTLPNNGEYTLAFVGTNRTNNNFALEIVTPELNTETLTLGETISSEISEAGEQDTYTFEGTIGQQLWLDELLVSSNVTATLYSPSDSQNENPIFSSNLSVGDDIFSRQVLPILPETGTYRLVIDGFGDTTEAYSFRLLDFADATAIDLDTEIRGDFGESKQETQLYRFNGTEGQQLYFDSFGGDSRNGYALYNPAGKRLILQNLNSDNEVITLPSTGEYTLAVGGNNHANNNFAIEIVTPEFTTESLTLGETISSEISEAGEQDTYTFEGSLGQTIYFDSRTGNSNFTYILNSPSGQQLFSINSNSDNAPITLTEPGTYQLIVDGNEDQTGNYSFVLSDTSLPLFFNTAFDGTFSARETLLYQFEGTAGQQLEFDSLIGNSSADWVLYAPVTISGSSKQVNAASLQNDFTVTLPVDGAYILALSNNSDSSVSYEFQVNDISTVPVVNSDIETLREGSISVAGEVDTYTFTANAGTLIYFDGQQGNGNLIARIKNPDGTIASSISTLNTRQDSGAFLTQTGDYTLEVFGSGSTTGDYRFRLIDLKESPVLDLNTQQDVSLNSLETKVFKFTGIAGQKIWLDGLNTNNTNVFSRLLNSSGLQIASASSFQSDTIRLQTLEADGEYYLVLHSNNSTATTTSFQLLSNTNATSVNLDTEIRGDFGESKQETQLYRFNGSEGQRLYFDSFEGDFNNPYYLYDSAGKQIFSQRLNSDNETITLSSDGEYTLVFEGNNSANNNNYALKIVTPEFTTEPLILGETITHEIREAGEQNTYTFEGTVGQQLWLDELLGSPNVTATLYSPSDSQNENPIFSSNLSVGDDIFSRQVLPILQETGTYRLVIDGFGDTTEAYSFRLLDFADATAIDLDTEIREDFGESKQETQLYRFNGIEGQQLYFDSIEGDSSNGYALYDPAGQRLFLQSLNRDNEIVTLPSSGEYTLAFGGNNRTNNDFALKVVTPEFNIEPLTLGETVNGEISEPGEQDTYTFEGISGQKLGLDNLTVANNTRGILYTPSGQKFWERDLLSDREPIILIETGTYRLVIDSDGDTTSAYSFRLGDFADAIPVDLDTEIRGDFGESKQEIQLYRFNGSEGQQLYFDSFEGDSSNGYALYDPAGQRLFLQSLNRDNEIVTLPSSGEYTLAFVGTNRTNNNFALEIVTPEFTTEPLTLGETISNEISEAGEQDTYTFEGIVGQKLWLDNLTVANNTRGILYTPSGQELWNQNLSGDRETIILQETGTYRLVIDGNGDTTESYSFRILDFADATPINLDTEITGDFGESKQETQLYRFNGSKGQQLYFDSFEGDSSNGYALYAPAGQRLFLQSLNSDNELMTLPSDGEYTLALGGNNRTNNNFALEIVTPEFTTTPLTLGETVSSEISELGEEDTYIFEGTVGQQLFFDGLVGNGNLNAQLYSPSGNLVLNLRTDLDGTPFTLTEAGTYSLVIDGVVIDGVDNTTGNYSFRLSDLTLVAPLELDAAIISILEPGNEVDLYQFTGTKGTILNFNLAANRWNGANWVFYNPNNGILAQPDATNPDFEVALPSDGLYTLAIIGNTTTPVDYSFQVTDNSVASIPITGTNTTVTGTVANGGDIDTYSFEASAGTLIWLDQISSTGFAINARLQNPDGTFIFSDYDTRFDGETILLSQTGTYTIETFGRNNSATGSWQFQLLELPVARLSANFNPLAFNSTIEGTVSPGTSAQVYSFDGTIGQQILFNGIEGESVNVYLYDPNGQTLFNINNFRTNNTDILTLKQDGIYHLVIDGNNNSDRNFAFELLDFAFGSELTPNLPVQGSLTASQTTDIYRISGQENQRLFFDINSGSASVRLKVYGINNNELLKNVALTTSSSFDLILPQDGDYTVYVEGNNVTNAIDYEFQVFAYDPFTDNLTPGTGESTSNNNGSLGLFPVQLQVEDGQGGTALQDFNIRLFPDPENTAPQIISTPLQTQIGLNQSGYSYQLESIDPDGDILSYRLLEAPNGSLIDRDTGALLWFPTESAIAGEIYDFTVEVSDGRGGKDSQSFEVEVFDTLGMIQGVVFEDLNQNGIPDTALLEGDDPDIFFVIDLSGSMGSSRVNWSTADLETIFEQDLSPLDQELGSILVLSEFLIAQGKGDESEIGIVTSGQNVIDMDPSQPGIQVSTTPLADNNNNGIRDIREAIAGEIGGGDSNTNGIRKAWEIQQTLPGDSNIIFMSDGFIIVDEALITEVKANGVNITAFGFALGGLDRMRRIDQNAVYISNPQEIGDIFSGLDPRYLAEPLLENITVYLDLNNNGLLDNNEPKQITQQDTDVSILGETTNYYFSFDNLVPGTYTVRQVVPDGYIETAPTVGSFVDTITVEEKTFTYFFGIHQISDPPNQDPTFTSIVPNSELIVGEQLRYQATAIDPNPDTLTFDLPLAPEGMVVNPETGYLAWNPIAAQTGEHTVILRVQDGRGGADIQYLEFSVQPPNEAPVFISILDNDTPQVGKPFQYQAKAIDADGDTLNYELVDAPNNVTIDATTGLVSWTPDNNDLGEQEFQVKVTDGKGGEALQKLNFNVIEATPNNAPNIISNPPSQARVNNLYAYQVVTEDIDNDPLGFNLTDAPDGMTIDSQGRITWNPDASQLGEHTVEVRVEDGQGGFATQSFTLDVNNRLENQAPSITSTPNIVTNTERVYQYQGRAIDPDGDYLIWSLAEAPQGMVIDETTGVLSWQPTAAQIGEHTVSVQVTDTLGLAVIQTFTLSVTGNNTPPVILSIPPTRGGLNQAYTYQVAANDPENDPLRFSLGVRPEGMTIDETTGEIQWTPTNEQEGSFTVEVIVADTQDGVGRQTYTLEVGTAAINQPPTIDSQPSFFADVTSTYTYQVEANDPEDGALTYSLLNAPQGMTIDADGLIQWNPNSVQLGVNQVSVAAFDSSGLGAVQTYTIQVQASNNAPIINSEPVLEAAAETTYRYDVRANDPDGERITYSLTQAPEGMEIDDLGRITWNPNAEDVGNYDIEVAVTDSRGATTTQNYQLTVTADTEAPLVNLNFDRDRANIGEKLTFQVLATDNVGIEELRLTINGDNLALDGNGIATVEIDSTGSFEVVASAISLDAATLH